MARTGSEAEAEDLLQDLYIKVAATPADGVANAEAFVFRLGMNQLIDRRRQSERRAAREAAWTEDRLRTDGDSLTETPDVVLQRKEAVKRLAAAIDDLPDRTGVAFRLHKLEELGQAEVARRMGISRSAVEKHIMRALKRLMSAAEGH